MDTRMQSVRDVLSGRSDEASISANATTSRSLIIFAIILSNVIGAAVVVTLLRFVLPLPRAVTKSGLLNVAGAGAIAAGVYVLVAVAIGTVVGLRLARPVIEFFENPHPPSEQDRRAVLRLPLDLFLVQAWLWGIAVVVFGGIALIQSPLYGFEVAITTVLGGIPTSSLAYLLTQRLIRAGTAYVLADVPPRRREVPGVTVRSLLAWGLYTVPIGGVLALTAFAPVTDMTVGQFARAAGVLCGVAIAVGLLAVIVFARSIAEPLQQLRDAFAHVEDGDFDVEVAVFDATEVGYASASFNRMVAGLRERERLRDLFGRQVGTDVARQAAQQGVTLGGAELQAAALFVDVIGSTSFAADRAPTEVVDALNEFFAAVVDATQEHGGFVNKFIGDAALCVFGAPLEQDDPAGAALAAARAMAQRLDGAQLTAGIGVAVGLVVAGNVGTAERYEYTVIGDPVNEAARLTELAKSYPGRVLASASAVQAAGEAEAEHWQLDDEVTLQGRSRPTRLAVPR